MSLRARMGLAAGLAVAIAVVAVALSAYVGTRSELRGQLDSSLRALSQPLLQRAGVVPPPRGGGPRDVGPPQIDGTDRLDPGATSPGSILGITARRDCDAGLGLDVQRGAGFGGAQGYVELVRPSGFACLAPAEHVAIPVNSRLRSLARRGSGRFYADAEAGERRLRVLAVGVGWRGALLVALPLSQVDDALSRELLLLVLTAAGGIALAALLGLLVARTALAPIARFTRQTEAIAERPERLEAQRIEVTGGDELARLARAFNSTLDALAQSVRSQRNLVADASHELRTPIASIRANIQLLHDERLLSVEDRAALRADVIDELDELTALVSDVVELARGTRLSSEPGELRLDEIVAEAVSRGRRRAPRLSFETSLEPTLVRGEGERIARAVTNLLDNAAKWSPEEGVVEVRLSGGVLTVRDHGPGFDESELPYIFDRFHRAKQARSKPGSGLGLAIVRQAADAHGGFVRATNAPGGGALLTASFGTPLEPPDQAEASAAETVTSGGAAR